MKEHERVKDLTDNHIKFYVRYVDDTVVVKSSWKSLLITMNKKFVFI